MNTQRTIWPHPQKAQTVQVIDQRFLPHQLVVMDLQSVAEVYEAIQKMVVRGAPLIGATAAYGVFFACQEAAQAAVPEAHFAQSLAHLRESRPTAVNLFWAIDQQLKTLEKAASWSEKASLAWQGAARIVEEDVAICRQIGLHGLPLLEKIAAQKPGTPVQVLTHCNAGRLGCIEWGTATAPLYLAHQKGLPLHVWVDETRPRNQGASLTAWELQQAGIPHTVIVDNTGGHLMQHGQVDICIVGTDRTTRTGDVANKIGTYLKALAAYDNQVPFYVALPSTTIDWQISDGLREIPIETRSADEVRYITGWDEGTQALHTVRLTPPQSPALNYGFDVTPARLITGLITERGLCPASEAGLLQLYPEQVLASVK